MSQPVIEQRRLQYRGREFHFVAYDGRSDAKQTQRATERAWWLMGAGTRWEVMPFHPDWDEAELDRALATWLDAHAFPSSEDGEAGGGETRSRRERQAGEEHAHVGERTGPENGEIQ